MRVSALLPALLVAAASALLPGSAPAAGCDVRVSFVDFGRVERRHANEVSGEVTVVCEEPTRFALALSEGRGSYLERRMRGPGGHELRYNVYVDAGRRRVWGDGVTAGTALLRGRNDGRRPTILPIYGRLERGQRAAGGAYGDQLVVFVAR